MTARLKNYQIWDWLALILLLFFAFLWLIPFYVMLRNALATNAQITSLDWVVWPSPMQWGNFKELFADPFVPMANGFKVPAIITVTTVFFQTLFALMAGYALARIPYRLSNLVFILIIGTMMMPSDALFVPTYAVVARDWWVDTFGGLIAPGLFSAFNTFMFRQHFLDFPKELEDAGVVDGLNWFGTFRRIALPNSWSIIIALGALSHDR